MPPETSHCVLQPIKLQMVAICISEHYADRNGTYVSVCAQRYTRIPMAVVSQPASGPSLPCNKKESVKFPPAPGGVPSSVQYPIN
eukprot:747095-Hanusia_phi.AAC.1